jgi:hypothetical protein
MAAPPSLLPPPNLININPPAAHLPVASYSKGACFVRGHDSIIFRMTEKEMVLKTVRELPDDCSIDEIADRIEFMAAVQEGLDQLDRGEGIPHEEIKKQLASWLTV